MLEAAGPDAVAAAVAHGGGDRASSATRPTDSRPFAFVPVDNASITRLVVLPGGRWILRGFNDVSHLR